MEIRIGRGETRFDEERNLYHLPGNKIYNTVSLSRCIRNVFVNHEFNSLDYKFYKNTNKPINQNENFVIERLDYASNRLIFDYNGESKFRRVSNPLFT
jgi:hypothetical protein